MSTLARYAALNNDPDPNAVQRIARRVFDETDGKIIILETERLTSWADRKQAELLAEKTGAKRKG